MMRDYINPNGNLRRYVRKDSHRSSKEINRNHEYVMRGHRTSKGKPYEIDRKQWECNKKELLINRNHKPLVGNHEFNRKS